MTTDIEETLVLVKPDGVARNLTVEILRRIEAKGYTLIDLRMVQADRELLANLVVLRGHRNGHRVPGISVDRTIGGREPGNEGAARAEHGDGPPHAGPRPNEELTIDH